MKRLALTMILALAASAASGQCILWMYCHQTCEEAYDWCMQTTQICMVGGQPILCPPGTVQQECMTDYNICAQDCNGDFDCGPSGFTAPGFEVAGEILR